jgi:hypothetical protein
MTYDNWRTTNPADEFLGPEPEEDEEMDMVERVARAIAAVNHEDDFDRSDEARRMFLRISGGRTPPSYAELGRRFGKSRHTVRYACQGGFRRQQSARKRSKRAKLYGRLYEKFGPFPKWPKEEKQFYLEFVRKQKERLDGRAAIRAGRKAGTSASSGVRPEVQETPEGGLRDQSSS